MTDNARIRTISDGVTAEMIAEQVHLFYNPATGSGSVSFQARESLFVAGAYQPLAGDYNILQTDVTAIATRQFADAGQVDPVTGADLSQISTGGVMLIIKAAYDKLYNERAAAQSPSDTGDSGSGGSDSGNDGSASDTSADGTGSTDSTSGA